MQLIFQNIGVRGYRLQSLISSASTIGQMQLQFIWLRMATIFFAWVVANSIPFMEPVSPIFNMMILFVFADALVALYLQKYQIGFVSLPALVLSLGDVIALIVITMISGGIDSPWFVMYYLVLAVAAIMFSMSQVICYAFVLSSTYIGAVSLTTGMEQMDIVVIRVFVLCAMGIITASLARQLVRQRMYADQRARAQHLLRESSQALTGSLHINAISDVIIQACHDLVGSDITLLVVNEDVFNTHLKMPAHAHLIVLREEQIRDTFGPAALALFRAGRCWISIGLPDSMRDTTLRIQAVHTACAFPLLINDAMIGVIMLGWQNKYLPDEDDMELLSTLASQSTVALETARLYTQALRASITDPLTMLYNHRYFKEQLEGALLQSSTTLSPLTLMMIDLDRFKSYNDMLGHAAGDTALRAVAAVLEREGPSRAITARYGGDEFIVVLPDMDLHGAKLLAAHIHKAIAELVALERVPSVMSLSIGLAAYPRHGDNRAVLLDSVDLAVALAKYDGGGCTRTAGEVGSAHGIEAIFAKMTSYLAQSRSTSGPGLAADLERRLRQLETLSKLEGQRTLIDPVAETLAIQTVTALATAIEAKDSFTRGHSQNVAAYAVVLGQSLEFDDLRLEQLRISGLLHDIGKIGITDTILNKPGPLDENERAIMRTHSEIGARILSPVLSLRHVSMIVLHHHEWFDGGGYPAGLRGPGIPLEARILSICDAYDVMTSGRPYSHPLRHEEAIARLQAGAGTQFDPDLVRHFVGINLPDLEDREIGLAVLAGR